MLHVFYFLTFLEPSVLFAQVAVPEAAKAGVSQGQTKASKVAKGDGVLTGLDAIGAMESEPWISGFVGCHVFGQKHVGLHVPKLYIYIYIYSIYIYMI